MTTIHVPGFITALIYAGVFYLCLRVLEWFFRRFAPKRAKGVAETVWWYYNYPFRWGIPDSVYKLWLQTGIITPEAYREYQDHGFIRDDLDPEYIQRQDTPE